MAIAEGRRVEAACQFGLGSRGEAGLRLDANDVRKAYRTREQLQWGSLIPDEVLDERLRDLQRVDLRRPRPHQAFHRHSIYAQFRLRHKPSIDILPCNLQNTYCVLR